MKRGVVIDLPIDWFPIGAKRRDWKVVRAEIVDVAPHLAHLMTFAVHIDPDHWEKRYQVSNVETGLSVFRIPTAGRNKAAVLRAVRERLAEKSPELCAKILADFARRKS